MTTVQANESPEVHTNGAAPQPAKRTYKRKPALSGGPGTIRANLAKAREAAQARIDVLRSELHDLEEELGHRATAPAREAPAVATLRFGRTSTPKRKAAPKATRAAKVKSAKPREPKAPKSDSIGGRILATLDGEPQPAGVIAKALGLEAKSVASTLQALKQSGLVTASGERGAFVWAKAEGK